MKVRGEEPQEQGERLQSKTVWVHGHKKRGGAVEDVDFFFFFPQKKNLIQCACWPRGRELHCMTFMAAG